MSTHTLVVQSSAAGPNNIFLVGTLNDYYVSGPDPYVNNGDSDFGICLQAINDGKDLTLTTMVGILSTFCYFQDDLIIPPGAVINSVQFLARVYGTNVDVFGTTYFSSSGNGHPDITHGTISGIYSILSTDVLDLNPSTGVAWIREDLFGTGDGENGYGGWTLRWGANAFPSSVGADYFGLIVDYVGLEVTSASPNHAGIYGGANIAITGSGFTDITKVRFGTVLASGIFILNDTTLTCTAPAHAAGPVHITVETEDNSATSDSAIFTFEQYSFTLDTTGPVRIGDLIKISTPVAPPGFLQQPPVLNGVDKIQINYTFNGEDFEFFIDFDSYYIIFETPDYLWFTLPPRFGRFRGPITITLIGDGVQFDGSVEVGTLEVLFEDASGIYRLTTGQTNDELYFRDGFTTDIRLIMLSNFLDDVIYWDDFFSLLSYPKKILANNDYDDGDLEADEFFIRAILRPVVDVISVEIPSPFIRTAFL